MNYFRIRVDDNSESGYTYAGSSSDSPKTLAEKIAKGEIIQLDDRFYSERGKIKNWAEWESQIVPTVYINGSKVIAFHQFKGDPRNLPAE